MVKAMFNGIKRYDTINKMIQKQKIYHNCGSLIHSNAAHAAHFQKFEACVGFSKQAVKSVFKVSVHQLLWLIVISFQRVENEKSLVKMSRVV